MAGWVKLLVVAGSDAARATSFQVRFNCSTEELREDVLEKVLKGSLRGQNYPGYR